MEELKHQDGITEEDIKDFEKAAIIMKSIEFVKLRAEMQAEIRKSKGKNLSHVKSKVKQCIKIQKKTAKKNRTLRKSMGGNPGETFGVQERDNSFLDSQMQTFNDNSVNFSASQSRVSPNTKLKNPKINHINEQLETQ